MSAVDVVLRVRNADFRKGMEQAKSTVENLRRQVGRGINLGNIAIGAVAIANLRRAAVEFDRIGKLASALRTDVESVQRMDFISSQSGTNIEAVSKALSRASRELARLADAGQTDGLAGLNVDIDQLRKLDPESLLIALAGAYSEAEDKARALADMNALFGQRVVNDLIPILELGADGIRALGNEIQVLSAVEIRDIEKLNDSLDKMGRTARAWAGKAIAWLIERVERLAALAGVAVAFISNLTSGWQAAKDAAAAALDEVVTMWDEKASADAARMIALNEERDALERVAEMEERRVQAAQDALEAQQQLTAIGREMASIQERIDRATTANLERGMGDSQLLARRIEELQEIERRMADLESRDIDDPILDAARQRDVLQLQLRRTELSGAIEELRDSIADAMREGAEAAAAAERDAVRERLEMWEAALQEGIDDMRAAADGMTPAFDSLRAIGVNLAGVDYSPDRDYQREQFDELRKANQELANVRRAIERLDLDIPAAQFVAR